MDIYVWISMYRYPYIYIYPYRYPSATFRYLRVDILFKKWISIHRYLGLIWGYVGSIWDICMQSIIPQPLAADPSHGRAKIAAIYVKVFVIF